MKLLKHLTLTAVAFGILAGSVNVYAHCGSCDSGDKDKKAEHKCCAEAKKAGKTCEKCAKAKDAKDAKKEKK